MSHSTSKGSNREAWIKENIDRDVIYGSIYGSPLTLQQGALLPMNLGSLYVQRLPFKACERLYATIFLPHCFIQRFDSSGISYLVPISPRPLQPATKDFLYSSSSSGSPPPKATGYYPAITLYLKQSIGLNSAVIQAIPHCSIVWLQQK